MRIRKDNPTFKMTASRKGGILFVWQTWIAEVCSERLWREGGRGRALGRPVQNITAETERELLLTRLWLQASSHTPLTCLPPITPFRRCGEFVGFCHSWKKPLISPLHHVISMFFQNATHSIRKNLAKIWKARALAVLPKLGLSSEHVLSTDKCCLIMKTKNEVFSAAISFSLSFLFLTPSSSSLSAPPALKGFLDNQKMRITFYPEANIIISPS